MPRDRITRIYVEGLRTLADLSIPLDGLTVLIGENGSGKSSILEACEILRRAAGPQFLPEVNGIHAGLFSLLRHGAQRLLVGARVEDADGGKEPLEYFLVLSREAQITVIESETLHVAPLPREVDLNIITRDRNRLFVLQAAPGARPIAYDPQVSLLGRVGWAHEGIGRMQKALEGIEVHVPFEVVPAWVARAHDRKSLPRSAMLIQPAPRLERLGSNLASAFATLRSEFGETHWQETMDYVRLGLGDRVESINARPSPEGGAVALWMKLRNRDEQIPPSGIADGALAFLALVAMFRLHSERTLLAFDEPELHLHPRLLLRVLGFFETIAESCPVILATHSDRLLDGLRDPARSVVLCELDEEKNETRLHRPDAATLAEWLDEYRGLGDLRSAGYLDVVMEPGEPA
jgi:predicted ATPase